MQSLPYVTLCPCAPGSAGASLAQNPVSQTALGQAQGAPRPPLPPPLPQRARAMGCPITSGVSSVGRRTRSWASSPLSHLCSTPILTFLISSKITQVPLGKSRGSSLQVEGGSPAKSFLTRSFCFPDWSSRCKQIMKLWRKVPAADKAPYLVRQTWASLWPETEAYLGAYLPQILPLLLLLFPLLLPSLKGEEGLVSGESV